VAQPVAVRLQLQRDGLVKRVQGRHWAGHQTRSKIPAAPCPMPTHMVTML
jgi:hypothetical protein